MTSSTIQSPTLESLLRAAVDSKQVPEEFFVSYSDMHGLHGGVIVSVRANGEVHRTDHPSRPPEPKGRTDSAALMQLIELLVELEAWKQITPERAPIPDESQAHVHIQIGHLQGGHWEWFNEMASNKRLARIRKRLERIAKVARRDR